MFLPCRGEDNIKGVFPNSKSLEQDVAVGLERVVNSKIMAHFYVAAPEDGRTPSFGPHALKMRSKATGAFDIVLLKR
jgi:hypothetical protein